jgi:hypothetical protein
MLEALHDSPQPDKPVFLQRLKLPCWKEMNAARIPYCFVDAPKLFKLSSG